MNAIQFIKENGVERAREVVRGAPDWARYFDGYLYSDKWFHGNSILISEINNLIENVDLVKRYGGIAEAKTLHQDEFWSNWKENADMQEQGAANAFEEAYWLLEQALKGEQP